MRSIPVPCGSSSRGCVRSRWPDPKGQKEGGGHCSFHCLYSITYQNLPRV